MGGRFWSIVWNWINLNDDDDKLEILIKWLKFVPNLSTEEDFMKSKTFSDVQDISICIEIFFARIKCVETVWDRNSTIAKISMEIKLFRSHLITSDLTWNLHSTKSNKNHPWKEVEEIEWLCKWTIAFSHVLLSKGKLIGIL